MSNVTINKDGTPRKKGSGRKKGANSFANVTLADLEKFCGSATLIPISRVWLESMGANISSEATTIKTQEKVLDKEEQKIEFKLHR